MRKKKERSIKGSRKGNSKGNSKEPIDDSLDALQKNGNYFYDKKLSIWKKILLFIDLIIFSVIYITLAFVFSWLLDRYTVTKLNRSRSDALVICEIIGELILILVVLYIIIVIIARHLPSIYPNPPDEHQAFKSYVLTILIVFGIFAGEYKFEDKIRYVFNRQRDSVAEGLDRVYSCWNNGDFPTCPP
mgnify:CR=1 FL=1